MAVSIKIDHGKLIECTLGVVCQEENGAYVAYVPALDLSSHGDSPDDAVKAAADASKIFIEELIQMGTADQVLIDLGWRKSADADPRFPYVPPHLVALYSQPVKIACHA